MHIVYSVLSDRHEDLFQEIKMATWGNLFFYKLGLLRDTNFLIHISYIIVRNTRKLVV